MFSNHYCSADPDDGQTARAKIFSHVFIRRIFLFFLSFFATIPSMNSPRVLKKAYDERIADLAAYSSLCVQDAFQGFNLISFSFYFSQKNRSVK